MKAHYIKGVIAYVLCIFLSACVAPEYGYDEVSPTVEPMFHARDAATTSETMIRPLT